MTKNNLDHGIKMLSSLHKNARLLALIEEKSLRFSKDVKLGFQSKSKISARGFQAQKPFGGVLLFSREDLAFIKLRSLLSCFLKALHVCMFAFLNNKRILFLGDPRPLVQEHQQRLLYWFIKSQVGTTLDKTRVVFTKDVQRSVKDVSKRRRAHLKKESILEKFNSGGVYGRDDTFGSLYSSLSAYQKAIRPKKESSDDEVDIPSLMSESGPARALPNQFLGVISEDKETEKNIPKEVSKASPEQILVEKLFGLKASIPINSKEKNSWNNSASLVARDLYKIRTLGQPNSSFIYSGKKGITGSSKTSFLRPPEIGEDLPQAYSNTEAKVNEKLLDQSREKALPIKSESGGYLNRKLEDTLFYSSIGRLVTKTSFRSTQWTATLAQPSNYWIGGFFSNNIARYRKSLSATTLTNIELDVPYSITNFFAPCYKPLYQGSKTEDYDFYSQMADSNNRVSGAYLEAKRKNNHSLRRNTFSATLDPYRDFSGGLWDAIFAPVPRKEMVLSSRLDTSRDYPSKYRGFRDRVPTRIHPKRRSKRFHRKTLLYCTKGVLDIKTRSPWIKEADLVFFANPEKSLSLLNQINRFNIPTLGIINSKSRLAIPFRTIVGPSYPLKSPSITYPIIGNPNSLHFLRLVLTRLSTLFNRKYIV